MKYYIHLLSDWHIGSGLSAGAVSDANVLKDNDYLPYIPGKTIKGLFKAALMEMPPNFVSFDDINRIFGSELIDPVSTKVKGTNSGIAFFSNASLSNEVRKEASGYNEFLYRNIASTSIDENGIAQNHSLRTMEVCMPLILEGEITGIPNEDNHIIKKAAKWIRCLGVNRNRGMGRCKIQIQD